MKREPRPLPAPGEVVCVLCGCTDSVACQWESEGEVETCSWVWRSRRERVGYCSCCVQEAPPVLRRLAVVWRRLMTRAAVLDRRARRILKGA